MDDDYIVDVCKFLFDDHDLTTAQLNDEVRDVAAKAMTEALKASNALDKVPRPSGNPGIGWLLSQPVRVFFRDQMRNGRVYETARVVVKAKWRSAYEMAKIGA